MPTATDPSIKSPALQRTVGAIIGWMLRALTATLRIKVVDQSGLSRKGEIDGPVIYALWHNRIVAMPGAWRRTCPWRQAKVLTSASKDGAALASAVGVFGIGAIRGSSTKGTKRKRGVGALIEMRKAIKNDGVDICITPDGPTGPRYDLKPGIVALAAASGAPIQPIHLAFGCALTSPFGFDGLRLPLPFSKITVTLAPLVHVEKGADEDEQKATIAELRADMLAHVEPSSILPTDNS